MRREPVDPSLWYRDAIFYQVNVRAYFDGTGDGHGDLIGLTLKLDYLRQLGVTCLWIMPIYPSPLNDDGYDISSYCDIHPAYGSLADFKKLLESAHARGIRIIMDLVLNHTSDQHPWFQAARADRHSPFRDYYVWSDDPRKYAAARIIFLDSEPSNWTWDEQAGQYYWHRFYASQPDLNYDNPAVQQEVRKILQFWLELGVDGFRADAVPYLFERDQTNCENLPETHAFLKSIRKYLNEQYPGRILLAEANQWPEDVLPYFGDGTDEFQMGFHFPVMPRIFMAMQQADRSPLVWIMDRTPTPPDSCQWCIFLRNHDELTLEMVTDEEREWMWRAFAPEPRMRLNRGIRRRLAPLLGNDQRRLELAHSILFTLPGSPILYYGDEIGMGDNIWLPDRNGVRTPMQWTAGSNAGFSAAPAGTLYAPLIEDATYGPSTVNVEAQQNRRDSLWNAVRAMIAVRQRHQVFGRGRFEWANCASDAVAAYLRSDDDETVLVINHLGASTAQAHVMLQDEYESAVELLSGRRISFQHNRLDLELQPYQHLWFKLGGKSD